MNRMPSLFIGHGSPMNAIQENEFTKMLNDLGKNLPRPKAVLMISAHWMTEGTWITGMKNPKTIHDFYGFPKELFDVQYPASGNPELAVAIQNKINNFKINIDTEMWGLDHGAWSILRHMYPKADVPVIQLSLYMHEGPDYHYRLGQELRKLRDDDIMIIGSGNIVHNLKVINWTTHADPYDWAVDFDHWVKEMIQARDFGALVHDFKNTHGGRLSVPTTEHYLPLLYVLGAASESDEINFSFEEIHNASISMRTVVFR